MTTDAPTDTITTDWPDALEQRPANPITINPAERTPCEIWTRCMGYHRPISAYNPGKQAEHRERLYFSNAKAGAIA